MLPAMYMASYGRNTPDYLGTIPLPRNHVPGMTAAPAMPTHHQPYHHMHMHASHPMAPAPMGMYPPSYSFPSSPARPCQGMPLTQAMFPPAYPAPMHVTPMAPPLTHDPNMHVQSAPELSGMHGGYAWQRPLPGSWRPSTTKGGGPPSRSTLPPLIADRQLPQHGPTSSAPPSNAAHPNGRENGARNGTSLGRDAVDHDAMAVHIEAGQQECNGHQDASLNRRTLSNGGLVGSDMEMDAAPSVEDGGEADVDWTKDAIANMKLDPGVGNEDVVHEAKVVLGEIQDGNVGGGPPMDLDELGWPAWPEANSSGNGDVDLEQGDEGRTGDPDDPVANAIADIFDGELSPQQKRRTRNSISASFM
jgi:hypothetical protein